MYVRTALASLWLRSKEAFFVILEYRLDSNINKYIKIKTVALELLPVSSSLHCTLNASSLQLGQLAG